MIYLILWLLCGVVACYFEYKADELHKEYGNLKLFKTGLLERIFITLFGLISLIIEYREYKVIKKHYKGA